MTGLSDLPDGQRDTLDALPPSAKLVAFALRDAGELTQGQLAEETLLPTRTVRQALRSLEDADLVTSRTSFVDARRTCYALAAEATPATGSTPAHPST